MRYKIIMETKMANKLFTKGQRKRLLDAGFSKSMVSWWDNRKGRPRPEKAVKISDITGVPVRTLLGIPIAKPEDKKA